MFSARRKVSAFTANGWRQRKRSPPRVYRQRQVSAFTAKRMASAFTARRRRKGYAIASYAFFVGGRVQQKLSDDRTPSPPCEKTTHLRSACSLTQKRGFTPTFPENTEYNDHYVNNRVRFQWLSTGFKLTKPPYPQPDGTILDLRLWITFLK